MSCKFNLVCGTELSQKELRHSIWENVQPPAHCVGGGGGGGVYTKLKWGRIIFPKSQFNSFPLPPTIRELRVNLLICRKISNIKGDSCFTFLLQYGLFLGNGLKKLENNFFFLIYS